MAVDKATALFGSFKRAETHDPDRFITGVTAIFTMYPVDVVTFLCDPTQGLPVMCDWLPTMREIKEACDREVSRIELRKKAEKFQRRAQASGYKGRQHVETFDPPEKKLRIEDYGPNWGVDPNGGIDARKPWAPRPLGEIMAEWSAKYGVKTNGQEIKEAVMADAGPASGGAGAGRRGERREEGEGDEGYSGEATPGRAHRREARSEPQDWIEQAIGPGEEQPPVQAPEQGGRAQGAFNDHQPDAGRSRAGANGPTRRQRIG